MLEQYYTFAVKGWALHTVPVYRVERAKYLSSNAAWIKCPTDKQLSVSFKSWSKSNCTHRSQKKKTSSQKVQKLKKKYGLGGDWACSWVGWPLLSMWFWQVCTTAVPVFSLPHCLQRNVKSKQMQMSIPGEHNLVPRWFAFNFAQVLSQTKHAWIAM